MSATLISLIVAAGLGAWVFNKLQRTTGNNTKSSAIAAGSVSIVLFIVLVYVFSKILS